jgi:cytochrome c peroxidase
VCNPVVPTNYPVTVEEVWGAGACDIGWPAGIDAVCGEEGGMVALSEDDGASVEMAYDEVTLAIAAFEGSPEVNPFSSECDAYVAGVADLAKPEKRDLQLFKGKCGNCHILEPEHDGEPPLFTDYACDNLGVPRNSEDPFSDQTDFSPLGDA